MSKHDTVIDALNESNKKLRELKEVTCCNDSSTLTKLTEIDTAIDLANVYLSAGVTKPSSNSDAGVTTVTLISAASANATVVKNSNGNVFGIDAMNNSSTIHYLKLYNKTTTPSSADTPLAVYMIPANTSGAGFVRDFTYPMEFSSGISYRIVTGIANNDNTSATANAITLNIQYE